MCVIFFKIRTISSQGRKLKKHGNRFLKNLSRSSHSVDPVISSWRRMKHRSYNRSGSYVTSATKIQHLFYV